MSLAFSLSAQAQCPVKVFATGLKAPTKMIMTPANNLMVSESGDGPNTGRISIINRQGVRRTLMDGLPSGLSAPENAPDGTDGILLRNRTLYVLNGEGDALRNGPAPGSAVANPNPSSPIFDSVMVVQFSADPDQITSGFTMTFADQTNLKNGQTVTLANASGDTLTVKLLVDFPDFTAAPRPDVPDNVRNVHLYGLDLIGTLLYIADAGQNILRSVDINTGANNTVVSFAPVQNTLPFGPPVSEAVPDSVHVFGSQLLVTELVGFPFPPGQASVVKVDPATQTQAPFITGLSAAIDSLPVSIRGGIDVFQTLEFSADLSAAPPPPGRMRFWPTSGGPSVTISDCLITPTSMVRDPRTSDMFVTEIGPGLVVRLSSAQIFVRRHYLDFLNREPDAGGLNYWTNEIERCGDDTACIRRRRTEVSAAFFIATEFQQTGFFVYAIRRASLGTQPTFAQYTADRTQLGTGSDADRKAFSEAFVQRSDFLSLYPASMNGFDFINALLNTVKQSSGVDLSAKKQELGNEYIMESTQTASRARVLRKLISYPEYVNAETNPAFVLSEYFGYLRRDPDPGGYTFWLNVLNNRAPNNYLGMVCAFSTSVEYQRRFYPIETEANNACSQ
jgi:hypothetical protein